MSDIAQQNMTNTPLSELLLIQPVVYEDDRGYFFESFNQSKLDQINHDWVQDNESKSTLGVLRGLHYQVGEHAQAKLVRVIVGEIYDVVVDIRPDSPTYGQWYGDVLSAQNKKQMYIPRGFAHGFVVTSDEAIFSYKCDNYYNAGSEGGIHYNDPSLNINWPMEPSEIILSSKDATLPLFNDHRAVW